MSKIDPQVIQKVIDLQLAQLAQLLSQPGLRPKLLAEAYVTLHAVTKALDTGKEGLMRTAKAMVTALVKEKGAPVEGQKGMAFEAEGWRFPIHPHRTGLDAKKVEGLLRAKKKDVTKYMTETKVYSLAPANLPALAKVLTPEEMKTCEYEENWVVNAPTRL